MYQAFKMFWVSEWWGQFCSGPTITFTKVVNSQRLAAGRALAKI